MRFSLQTLAFIVCLTGLGLAVFVLQSKNFALAQELLDLQRSVGLVDFSPGEDHYRLTTTGDGTIDGCAGSQTYLLRVENFSEYQIEVTHYRANNSKVMRFDLQDPIVTIDFIHDAPLNNLFICSLQTSNVTTFHSARFDVDTLLRHSFHGVSGAEIDEENVIISLFFGPEGFQIPFGKNEFHWYRPITLAKSNTLCDACNIEAISFRLVPRSN